MITADFHTHSSFSWDSDEPMEEMVKSAMAKGIKTLCITEHCDIDYPEGWFYPDFWAYREEHEHLRIRHAHDLDLLFGVELGVMKYLAPELIRLAVAYDFDFIIASSHLVDGVDPYYPEYFERFGTGIGILRYFDAILENIRAFSEYDVYGHLDYAVRYCGEKEYSPLDYREIIDEILKLLVKNNKGIEVNTAGLRSGLAHCNPHPFILKRFKELGGRIVTIGSDAHKAEDIGKDFDIAEEMLKEAGFDYYTIFKRRMAEFVKL